MRRLLPLLFLCALAAGCGKSEAEKQREAKSGRGPLTCSESGPSAVIFSFPIPHAVSLVKSREVGPTTTYTGYSTASLDDTFLGFKSAFAKAGYEVEKTDHEKHDAELEFKAKGGKTGGQVALRDGCDNGNVSVRITARPQ